MMRKVKCYHQIKGCPPLFPEASALDGVQECGGVADGIRADPLAVVDDMAYFVLLDVNDVRRGIQNEEFSVLRLEAGADRELKFEQRQVADAEREKIAERAVLAYQHPCVCAAAGYELTGEALAVQRQLKRFRAEGEEY